MFPVILSDLTVDTLRRIAGTLGVPNSMQIERGQLETEIKQRLAPNTALALGLFSDPKSVVPSALLPKLWQTLPFWALATSVIAVLIAVVSATAGWRSSNVAVEQLGHSVARTVEEDRKRMILEWQDVIVFSIIESGTKNSSEGLSFETIRSLYISEATAASDVDVPRSELSPFTLKRILLDLLRLSLIFQTHDDKYMTVRNAPDPKFHRSFFQERAKYEILHMVSNEGGKHTVDALGKLITDRMKINNEEFDYLLNYLLTLRMIAIDKDRRVWTAANAPPGTPMIAPRD